MHRAPVGSGPEKLRPDEGLVRSVHLRSAAAMVVASMVGVGIFTTTGFQAEALGSPVVIYLLWIVGGLLALCGALAYGELGAAMPRAGGEYVYLREAYGGSFAFMSAIVSLTAGFSAPIAAALESFVRYLAHFFPALAADSALWGGLRLGDAIAICLVWLLVGIHSRRAGVSIKFNDWITVLKVAGILGIILAAAAFGEGDAANLARGSADLEEMSWPALFTALGTSLVFVMFCYSGWNSAAYLGGEVVQPQRTLPRAMLLGTALVMGLYLALNLVYFYGASVDELSGKVEVGLVAARGLFGPAGVTATNLVVCLSLLGAASAMTITGPRVYFALGRDHAPLHFLARTGTTGAPSTALLVQGIVASIMIAASRVDQIQQYAGFTLSLFATLAVAAVIVLRVRQPAMERPFRTWGYPVTPLVFISVSVWMMYWAAQGRPVESMLGALTVGVGGLLYLLLGHFGDERGAAELSRGALTRLAERVIHRVVRNSAFFYYARTHFYWGTMKRLRRALDLRPGERLLDVGCGSGMGAGLTRGMYVGVDTEMSYLRFARGRLRRRSTHSFVSMSAMELGFIDGGFDKAMMLNLVHHLDEAVVDRFLEELTRVVRKKVFVLDHAPGGDNAVSGWLLSLDRGAHIRRRGELRRLLERHFDVEKEETFFNLEHTISHVLFTLVPKCRFP